MSTFIAITSLIFLVFAIAHARRLARGWQVQVGPHNISMSLSWIALVAAAALVIWGGILLNG
jgi:L-alanine-DL-glutamate epimerase-like enolase superfamily enzyme